MKELPSLTVPGSIVNVTKAGPSAEKKGENVMIPQISHRGSREGPQSGFHLRGGAQGKLPPQTAQLPPQTDPTSPQDIVIMKSTLPSPWPYGT